MHIFLLLWLASTLRSVRVEYGAFQTLGEGCLTVEEGTWAPDFSAHMLEVVGEVREAGDNRVLKISSSAFKDEFGEFF